MRVSHACLRLNTQNKLYVVTILLYFAACELSLDPLPEKANKEQQHIFGLNSTQKRGVDLIATFGLYG